LGYQAELIGAAALVMENYEKEFAKKNLAVEPGPGQVINN
jgi:hypothetical protein